MAHLSVATLLAIHIYTVGYAGCVSVATQTKLAELQSVCATVCMSLLLVEDAEISGSVSDGYCSSNKAGLNLWHPHQ